MPAQTWKQTQLWGQLEKSESPGSDSVRATLTKYLPKIEKILAKGAPPNDFTLHDEDHAFRVAEWMVRIIPNSALPQLSPYELALLLLSGYLHDIGMTPSQKQVRRHWHHLLYGKAPDDQTPDLDGDEGRLLQQWLDDQKRDVEVPICQDGAATQEQIRRTEDLITHYCRARHNDWSADYIRTQLGDAELGDYEKWVDDLVTLCRSHHEGYEELRQDRFNARPVDAAEQVVHLRYLACVLRVADILDVDPERTPKVVFAHRDISRGSVLYWRKDHATWLTRDDQQLVLTARPDRAYLEKAIRDTAAEIEHELRTCDRLNREMPFTHASFRTGQPLPHVWDFPAMVNRQIQAKEDTYVYIDGAFRPNTDKLLEILGGRELYGNPLVAVRELLQNAFDAVREKIAHERLALENPADRKWQKTLGEQHHVRLRFEKRDDRYWLICSDDGVGMTQQIIRDHLLVSGNPRQRRIRELERKCRNAGFRLGRTGQFGIGVLSYFMLADHVEIRTRRAQDYDDAETHGWSFETSGVGSFGELRHVKQATPGTETRLGLRDLGDYSPQEWYTRLDRYLRSTLRYIPCKLTVDSTIEECAGRTFAPGWCVSEVHLGDWVVSQIKQDPSGAEGTPEELLPWAKRQEIEETERHIAEARAEARKCLRWHTEEGELPDDLGRFRIVIPYFELPGGECAGFMRVSQTKGGAVLKPLGKGELLSPELESLWAWYGMTVPARIRTGPGSTQIFQARHIVEVDWEHRSSASISVNRGELNLSATGRGAFDWVRERARDVERTLFPQWPNEYSELNIRLCPGLRLSQHTPCWRLDKLEGQDEPRWGPISFPAVDAYCLGRPAPTFRVEALSWQGREVTVLRPFSGPNMRDNGYWVFGPHAPDRVVSLMPHLRRVTGLWTSPPVAQDPIWALGLASSFPPSWAHVCGLAFQGPGERDIWNTENPVVQAADAEAVEWWSTRRGDRREERPDPDPLAIKDEILRSRGRAAVWLLHQLRERQQDLWTGLAELAPEFIGDVWRMFHPEADADGTCHSMPLCWVSSSRWLLFDGCALVTANEYRLVPLGDEAIADVLPDPGSEWRLEIVKGKAIE